MNYNDVKKLFKLRGDNWYGLPTYKCSTAEISEYKETINIVIKTY